MPRLPPQMAAAAEEEEEEEEAEAEEAVSTTKNIFAPQWPSPLAPNGITNNHWGDNHHATNRVCMCLCVCVCVCVCVCERERECQFGRFFLRGAREDQLKTWVPHQR